ncbi:low affinity iron permease family protein [Legionella sp. WA2022007384]
MDNLRLWFQKFSSFISEVSGSLVAFITAFLLIIVWLITGPIFKFSDTWQLVINTGTTIITFLMVFLIQHTQNRDNKIINLKLDELIKSHPPADNHALDLEKLTDEELQFLEKKYKKICGEILKK